MYLHYLRFVERISPAFILLGIFLPVSFVSAEVNQRRYNIIKIIDQEIRQVDKLQAKYKGKNPSLFFRKSELILEKGRVLKEIENEDYLSISPKRRAKLNRKNFFRKSNSQFRKAKDISLYLLKRFKSYKYSADVYYILGFNEKEIGNPKQAIKYFLRAEKYARKGTKAKIRIENALAETYYIQKNYKKAEIYYRKNINNIRDKWWTKDAFNLSWSYFRNKKYSSAITLMKKVYSLSENPKYIDMRDSVVRDIGLFYAEAGRVEDGLNYFKSINKDFTKQMVSLAFSLKEGGKYTQALTVLTESLKLDISEENRIKILLARIDLFDKYEKNSAHLKDSIKIYRMMDKYKLPEQQYQEYLYQVKKQVSILQKRINSRFYKRSRRLRNQKVKQVIAYLTILKKLEPDKTYQIDFYKAETYFQAKDYEKSLSFYRKSLEKNDKDEQMKKRSLEGMLAAIAVPKTQFKKVEQFVPAVYATYLKTSKNGPKNKEITKRLFKFHYDKKNTKEMESTLDNYAQKYPSDINGQERMVNSLMERLREKNDNRRINQVFAKIDNDDYRISKKGKQNLYGVYQKIEIKKLEDKIKNKEYAQAIQGYRSIYYDKKTSKLAKSNASYNLMVLYFKDFALKNTYEWAKISLNEISNKDFLKYKNSYLSVSKYLFERLQFDASADISHRSIAKICPYSDKIKNQFFLNATINYKISKNWSRFKELGPMKKRCKIQNSSWTIYQKEKLDYLYKEKEYAILGQEINKYSREKSLLTDNIFYSGQLLKMSDFQKERNYWRKTINVLQNLSVKNGIRLELRALDVLAELRVAYLEDLVRSLKTRKLRFPEQVFNKQLTGLLGLLEKITDESLKIQNIGSGDGITKSFDLSITSYQYVYDLVRNFRPPSNKGAQYIAGFNKAMSGITNSLQAKIKEFKASFDSVMSKNNIMTSVNLENSWLLTKPITQREFINKYRLGAP
jgi:tetratricopeptide (TPR) repeat protein